MSANPAALVLASIGVLLLPALGHAQAAADTALASPVPEPVEGRDTSAARDDFADVEEYLGESGPWVLDDGVSLEEMPWDDYHPTLGYAPRGVHFGVQLRIAALPGDAAPAPDGPLIEVVGLLDIRYSQWRAGRMRLALVASWQPHGEQYLGAGTTVSSAALTLRLRMFPLAFDFGRWVGVRLGADVGFQWGPPAGGRDNIGFAGGPTAEVVLLLEGGLLEVGLVGGMHLTSVVRATRSGGWSTLTPEAVVGATVAYLIP